MRRTSPIVLQHQDWLLRCYDRADRGTCEALMIANISVDGTVRPAFRLSISRYQEDDLLMVVLVPHDHSVYLPNGVNFFVDGEAVSSHAMTQCNSVGCFLQTIAEPSLLRGFRRGRQGTLRVTLTSGKNLDIQFSLMGVTSALDDLAGDGPFLDGVCAVTAQPPSCPSLALAAGPMSF